MVRSSKKPKQAKRKNKVRSYFCVSIICMYCFGEMKEKSEILNDYNEERGRIVGFSAIESMATRSRQTGGR